MTVVDGFTTSPQAVRSAITLGPSMKRNSPSSSSFFMAKSDTQLDVGDFQRRSDIVMNSSLFSMLEWSELYKVITHLEEVKVNAGEAIIYQGSKDDDDMYFVVDGQYGCYGMKDDFQVILKKYDGSGCFGELALFFSTPRALSIRAITDGTLLRLSRDVFDASVQESDISSEALKLLYKSYEEESIWSALPKLSPEELYETLVVKSRPKKKAVSLHSTLSGFAMGAYITSLVPVFNPSYNDILQSPQIFQMTGHIDESILKAQLFGVWALTITGIMGLFRLPPRAPPCRAYLFLYCAMSSLSTALLTTSNLAGVEYYLIDGFTAPWKYILLASAIISIFIGLLLLDDAVAGEMRGRDTIIGAETRLKAIPLFAATTLSGLTALTYSLAPFFTDRASYDETFVAFIKEAGIEGANVITLTAGVGVNAFIGLFTTLIFEKKLTQKQASSAYLMAVVILLTDPLSTTYAIAKNPELYKELASNQEGANFYLNVAEHSHALELTIAAVVITALNAFRKVIVKNGKISLEYFTDPYYK